MLIDMGYTPFGSAITFIMEVLGGCLGFWILYAILAIIIDTGIRKSTVSQANAHYISLIVTTILYFFAFLFNYFYGKSDGDKLFFLLVDLVSPFLIILIKPIQIRNRAKLTNKIKSEETEHYIICPKCQNQMFDNEEKCSNCGYERHLLNETQTDDVENLGKIDAKLLKYNDIEKNEQKVNGEIYKSEKDYQKELTKAIENAKQNGSQQSKDDFIKYLTELYKNDTFSLIMPANRIKELNNMPIIESVSFQNQDLKNKKYLPVFTESQYFDNKYGAEKYYSSLKDIFLTSLNNPQSDGICFNPGYQNGIVPQSILKKIIESDENYAIEKELKNKFGNYYIKGLKSVKNITICDQNAIVYEMSHGEIISNVGEFYFLAEVGDDDKRYFALEFSYNASFVFTEWEFLENGNHNHKNYGKLIDEYPNNLDKYKSNTSYFDQFVKKLKEIIGNDDSNSEKTENLSNTDIDKQGLLNINEHPVDEKKNTENVIKHIDNEKTKINNIINYKGRYRDYLIKLGYKEYTPSGNPSTVYQYIKSIELVMYHENYNYWQDVADNIDELIPKYDIGGKKEKIGNQSKRSVINALKRFEEFLRYNKE